MTNKKCDIYIAALWRQGFVKTTVDSLKNQPEFGTATITCNNHTDAQWQDMQDYYGNDDRIILHRHDNEKCSNEKLRYVAEGYNDYMGFFDNDLIYPEDYLAKLMAGVDKYNAMVGLHGVVFKSGQIASYYRDRHVFRGLKAVDKDYQVDLASNCGSMFKRSWFTKKELGEWYDRVNDVSMDDIYVAYFMLEKGIPKVVLAHEEGYTKHKQQFPEDDYVFNKHALVPNGDVVQTAYVNDVYKKLQNERNSSGNA